MLSPQEFTDFFVACLRQNRPDLEIESEKELELKFRKKEHAEKPHQAFLDNAYTVYQNDPDSRDDIIDQFIAGQLETLDKEAGAGINEARIVPVVKDRRWLEEVSVAMREKNSEFQVPLHDNYNSELQVIYAEDSEHNIRYLNSENLEDLPCSRKELQALAVKNLGDLLREKIEVMGGDGIYVITCGGSYETSLLLLEELWASESPIKVKGKPVAAIPTRDMLLVSGNEDEEGIQQIREIAANVIQENAYTLTPVLFEWNGENFEVFEG